MKMEKKAHSHVFTSESVSEGHPDKVADQISDAVLDACLRADRGARVACETMVGPDVVVNMGEIACRGFEKIDVEGIARKVGIRLPAYRVTRAEDNLGRTASAWTNYLYEIEFEEPLTDAFLKKVGKMKTYNHEGDVYIIEDESPDEWSCLVRIYPEKNTATLEYDFWDALF